MFAACSCDLRRKRLMCAKACAFNATEPFPAVKAVFSFNAWDVEAMFAETMAYSMHECISLFHVVVTASKAMFAETSDSTIHENPSLLQVVLTMYEAVLEEMFV